MRLKVLSFVKNKRDIYFEKETVANKKIGITVQAYKTKQDHSSIKSYMFSLFVYIKTLSIVSDHP